MLTIKFLNLYISHNPVLNEKLLNWNSHINKPLRLILQSYIFLISKYNPYASFKIINFELKIEINDHFNVCFDFVKFFLKI